jgi:hypothetical protein
MTLAVECDAPTEAALCKLLASLQALQELSIRPELGCMRVTHFASSPAVQQRITSLTTSLSQEWLQLLGQAASFQPPHIGGAPQRTRLQLPPAQLTLDYLCADKDGCTLSSPPGALDTLTVRCIHLECVLQHRWLLKVGSPASRMLCSPACIVHRGW